MRYAFLAPFECPGCPEQAWVVVAIEENGFEPRVLALESRAEAMDALMNSSSWSCEGFVRPVACPGRTGELLFWFSDDFDDVGVRAFATKAEAQRARAALIADDGKEAEAPADATEKEDVADAALRAAGR